MRDTWGVGENERDSVVEDLCGRGPETWVWRMGSFLLFLLRGFRLWGKLVAGVENGFGEYLEEFFAGEDTRFVGGSWLGF